MTYASKHVRSDGPGVKRTHLIHLLVSAAACKAVYAGSIPTPASKNQILSSSYAHVESPRVAKSCLLPPRKSISPPDIWDSLRLTRVRQGPFDDLSLGSGSVPETETNLGRCLLHR
jgi:hypothetical protein